MITGYATVDNAVESMKIGAFDFVRKPLDFERLLRIIENALHMRAVVGGNGGKEAEPPQLVTEPTVASPRMHELFERARRIAQTNLPLLILGEHGTGKEMLADYIHSNSLRNQKTILKVNCAAFPESLLDNELFGHEKGSYTGADVSFPGIFERADGGTLFLDEIGDMPALIQAKILRVLQNGELRRIGGKSNITIDVRFVAASNKNLTKMMENGQFREDLMFRLNAAMMYVPPLRERREEIPVLAERFLQDLNRKKKTVIKTISEEVMHRFIEYQWPGNVRELENAVAYSYAISQGDTLGFEDLPPILRMDMKPSGGTSPAELDPRSQAEAAVIRETLRKAANNKKLAAELLHMSRNTLYKKIALYGIGDPDG